MSQSVCESPLDLSHRFWPASVRLLRSWTDIPGEGIRLDGQITISEIAASVQRVEVGCVLVEVDSKIVMQDLSTSYNLPMMAYCIVEAAAGRALTVRFGMSASLLKTDRWMSMFLEMTSRVPNVFTEDLSGLRLLLAYAVFDIELRRLPGSSSEFVSREDLFHFLTAFYPASGVWITELEHEVGSVRSGFFGAVEQHMSFCESHESFWRESLISFGLTDAGHEVTCGFQSEVRRILTRSTSGDLSMIENAGESVFSQCAAVMTRLMSSARERRRHLSRYLSLSTEFVERQSMALEKSVEEMHSLLDIAKDDIPDGIDVAVGLVESICVAARQLWVDSYLYVISATHSRRVKTDSVIFIDSENLERLFEESAEITRKIKERAARAGQEDVVSRLSKYEASNRRRRDGVQFLVRITTQQFDVEDLYEDFLSKYDPSRTSYWRATK